MVGRVNVILVYNQTERDGDTVCVRDRQMLQLAREEEQHWHLPHIREVGPDVQMYRCPDVSGMEEHAGRRTHQVCTVFRDSTANFLQIVFNHCINLNRHKYSNISKYAMLSQIALS